MKKRIEYLDLGQISESGQCFRMYQREKDCYCVIAFGRCLVVKQRGDEFTFSCDEKEFKEIWAPYFDLDFDYQKIVREVDPDDTYLSAATQFGKGIRILNQDLWEIIISFIISQQNNISRIRKCIELLCKTYGEEKFDQDNQSYFTFPTADVLAKVTEEELRQCNMGYRSRYLVNTAKSIQTQEVSLECIKQMNYTDAKEELLKLSGVGEKVADCICLFALHHLNSFPVDTHIKQVLDNHYQQGFPFERYKGYEGVIQQYLFYYDLNGRIL